MKLDPVKIRYLTSEEFRVLTAVENGSRNHEMVPVGLIASIAGLRGGGSHKVLSELLRKKLVDREAKNHYEGFRLTYGGYDFLALKTFAKREVLYSVGNQIGVGKESDVYIVAGEEDLQYVLKIHRLGRTSFRSVKKNRDYLRHRKSASWLYLSRLSAMKEFAFMKVLYDNGFPVPRPIDVNRHCVVMELLDAFPMVQVQEVGNPGQLYSDLMDLIVRLAQHGLIHGDYNEFNIMITKDEKPILIDFPQMISTSHANAEWYFNRDIECIRVFFKKRFNYESVLFPKFTVHGKKEFDLDVQVAASGFSKKNQQEFDELLKETEKEQDLEEEEGSDSDEDDEEENVDNTELDTASRKFQQIKIVGDTKEGEEEEEEEGEDEEEATGDEDGDEDAEEEGDKEEEEEEEDHEDGDLENNNRSYRPFRNTRLPPPSALQDKEKAPKKVYQPLTDEEIRRKVKVNLEKRSKAGGKSPNKVKSKQAKKVNDHMVRGKDDHMWM